MIILVAIVLMAAWAVVCRRIHMDLVISVNKETGRVLIPRRQTLGFFIWGCAMILFFALAAMAIGLS